MPTLRVGYDRPCYLLGSAFIPSVWAFVVPSLSFHSKTKQGEETGLGCPASFDRMKVEVSMMVTAWWGRQAAENATVHTLCPGVGYLSPSQRVRQLHRFKAAGSTGPNQTLSWWFLGRQPAGAGTAAVSVSSSVTPVLRGSVWSLTLSCCQLHPTILCNQVTQQIPQGTSH